MTAFEAAGKGGDIQATFSEAIAPSWSYVYEQTEAELGVFFLREL